MEYKDYKDHQNHTKLFEVLYNGQPDTEHHYGTTTCLTGSFGKCKKLKPKENAKNTEKINLALDALNL